jgi:hypothetical protein
MQLGNAYPAIRETNSCNAFELPPTSWAISFTKTRKVTNATADGDGFNLCELTDDLKVHRNSEFGHTIIGVAGRAQPRDR